MNKNMYFRLQLKRILRLYPSVLLITAITLCGILLSASILVQKTEENGDKQKINIAVVGDSTESYLGVGIYALQNLDSSRFSVNILEMEKEEAERALQNREIAGYLRLPADFVEGIIYGRNEPATFVTLGGPAGLGTLLTGEVTEMVSGLVTESQRALYALQTAAAELGETEGLAEKVTRLNMDYIEKILARSGTYKTEYLVDADVVSTGGYYICGMYIFFLLFWGISCTRILRGRDTQMQRLLWARGCGGARQVLGEYGAFFLITAGTMLLLALVAGFFVAGRDFGIPELEGCGVLTPFGFVLQSLPVLLLISSMQFLMYESTYSTVSATLLQFLAALGMGYLCGCLYPLSFFPDLMQKIGGALPAGVGFSYLRQCMSGTSALLSAGGITLYTAAFLLLTVWLRKRRMEGDTE
ncbi:MAG: ABC transporter permease [Clostridia bacterium]|nr:ABC transporter permease [Clostridia bacterium]